MRFYKEYDELILEFAKTIHEKFTWDPRTWFSPKLRKQLDEQEKRFKQETAKHARESIAKLKKILKERNYVIIKDGASYTTRKERKLALSRDDIRSHWGMKRKVNTTTLPWMNALFSMAHEVGHVLQWREHDDRKVNFEEFFKELEKVRHSRTLKENVLHIHQLWYELDAWIRGMEFIPEQYREQYKKYALFFYKSYMKTNPRYYYEDEAMLRMLLTKLDFEIHYLKKPQQ